MDDEDVDQIGEEGGDDQQVDSQEEDQAIDENEEEPEEEDVADEAPLIEEVDPEVEAAVNEAVDKVDELCPALDKLNEADRYDDMQNILGKLLEHCAFRRIEKELSPEKKAAHLEH